MKGKKFPLFWKLNLWLFVILVVSAAAMFCFDMLYERETVRQVEAKCGVRRENLQKLTVQMAREFENLAVSPDRSEAREAVLKWAQRKKLDSGLDIYVTLEDTAERETFAVHVNGARAYLVSPLAAQAGSPSGKLTVYTTLEPYQDWDELRTPIPMKLFLLTLLSGMTLGYFIVRHLVAPLGEMERVTEALMRGDFSARVGKIAVARRDEFGQFAAAFNVMAGKVEALLQNQKRLLIDISHELRSPLQRLSFAHALIEKSAAGHLDEASLRQANLDVRRLDEMVEELLTLTRAEAPGGVRADPVSLGEEIRVLLDEEKFEWNGEGRSVEFSGGEAAVRGDARLLRRAIRNLIHNAVWYSPAGGKVEVSLAEEDGDAVLRVRDYGLGVPDEDLERIFAPFYRTSQGRERVSGGTGLGLHIVRCVAEKHGGSCAASNAPDGGLVMTFRVPEGVPSQG